MCSTLSFFSYLNQPHFIPLFILASPMLFIICSFSIKLIIVWDNQQSAYIPNSTVLPVLPEALRNVLAWVILFGQVILLIDRMIQFNICQHYTAMFRRSVTTMWDPHRRTDLGSRWQSVPSQSSWEVHPSKYWPMLTRHNLRWTSRFANHYSVYDLRLQC